MKTTAENIRKAQETLIDSGIVKRETGVYDSVFKGYISRFGASVVQAGLLPTVIFYEDKNSDAKERIKVINALKQMLGIDSKVDLALHILNSNSSNSPAFLADVTTAMVALKLALRMYKEEKKNKKI